MSEIKPYWKNYIDGAWTDGGAGSVDIYNPGTGEKLAAHALANATDVDRAVQAAKRVHQSGALAYLRPVERGRMVRAMGDYLAKNIDEIAQILTLEQGKPIWESRIEIESSSRFFEYYGNQAETLEGRSIPLGGGYFDFTTCEPYGVSAQIIPWNYPVEMTARSLSAALAAGNACVIKTPELTPLSCAWIARAAEAAGLPKGAVNVICGYGTEAGAALSGHPDVNQLVFTGSVQTGIAIATAAARNVVPCILELGGKSAAIVHSDADLDALENSVRWGIYFNAGQVCSAMSRIVAHESIHDQLLERVTNIAKSLSVGPGIERTEFGANMGSMVSDQQRNRAAEMVFHAQSQGATVATGGRSLNIRGAFLEPCVIFDTTPNMAIVQKEVFGPVLTMQKFRTDAEAVQLANGTPYGLAAGIFTRDIDRATRAARDLRAGAIYINEWYAGGVETPFGGYGRSGYGREKGREALWNYVQTKNIAVKLNANSPESHQS